MLIVKRHPTLKRASAAERGVMGTYAAAVLAAAGSILALGLTFGGSADSTAPAGTAPQVLSPDAAQVWADSDPTFRRKPAVQEEDRAVRAAEEQPIYDEAAAVLVYTR